MMRDLSVDHNGQIRYGQIFEGSTNERMEEEEGGKEAVKLLCNLPVEILISVISLLSVKEVCALSSCSRFWRALCGSDEVWIVLYSRQWPLAEVDSNSCFLTGTERGGRGLRRSSRAPAPSSSSPSSSSPSPAPSLHSSSSSSSSSSHASSASSSSSVSSSSSRGSVGGGGGRDGRKGRGESWGASSYGGGRTRGSVTRGEVSSAESIIAVSPVHNEDKKRVVVPAYGQGSWRMAYTTQHKGVLEKARRAMGILRECSVRDSVEVGEYHRALAELHGFITFNDVVEHLFGDGLSVLVNLLGIHFAVMHLKVPLADVSRALNTSGIARRQVCVRLWSIGGLVMGYRRRDEIQVFNGIRLEKLFDGSNNVLQILERGTVHEVRRVQISADFHSSAWVGREHHWQR